MAPWHVLLTSVEYRDGNDAASWYLELRWDIRPPVPAADPGAHYVAQLLVPVKDGYAKVGRPVHGGDEGGVWTEASAGYNLVPGTSYFIQALAEPGPSWVRSNVVPVLWRPPSIGEVTCDGSRLVVGWTPAEPGATGARGTLDAPGGPVWAGSSAPVAPAGTGVASVFDVSLAPLGAAAAELTLTLNPVARDAVSVSVGPAATAPTLTHQPVVLGTAYDSRGAATLTFSAQVDPAGYTGTSYEVEVRAGGTRYAGPGSVTATLAGGTATLPVIVPVAAGGSVAPGLPLALVVRAAGAVATGPASAPFPLLAVPPVVTAARVTAGGVDLSVDSPTGAAVANVTKDGTVVATAVVAGATGRVALPAESGNYALTVAALAGTATGVPCDPLPLPLTGPQPVWATYDGATVVASWTEPTPPAAAYRLDVESGGVPVATTTAHDTTAAVAVPAGGTLALRVTGVTGPVDGPPSEPLPLVTSAPEVTGAATAPLPAATDATVLTWSPVAGATGYLVQRFRDGLASGPPVPANGPKAALTLTAAADEAVAVAAVVTAGSTTVRGPYGTRYPLVTGQPVVTEVDFDGTTAAVGWTPVSGATGYTVSVLAGGTIAGTADAAATATRASVAVATTAAGDYTVVVQARRGAATGPPSATAPLVPGSFFLSAHDPVDPPVYPYVYPGSGVQPAPAAATVPLPSLGPRFKGPVAKGVFAIEVTDAVPTLSVGTTAFTASARAALQSDYVAFLTAAEGSGADADGLAALQTAIARVMPQTFDETLYYAYGFDPAAGSVDLRPGMVLRVAFADYVNVGVSNPPPYVNGYAAAGSVDYEVSAWESDGAPDDDDARRVGLDAFLARLVASGALVVSRPAGNGDVVSGAGDAADLFGLLGPVRYLRLFAPPRLAAPGDVGTSVTSSGFAVAAAASWADIEAATRSPQPGRPVVGFRGRAVVRACVHVTIGGADVVVPIGTTVGDVLARRGARPPRGATAATGVVLDRVAGPPTIPAGPYDVAAARRVRFDWHGVPAYPDGLDAFSLPLLAGDRLTVGR